MVSLMRLGFIVILFSGLAACSMQPLIDVGIERPQPVPPAPTETPQQTTPSPEAAPKKEPQRQISVQSGTSLPKAAASLLQQAQDDMKLGNARAAVSKLERASSIAPRSAEVYVQLAKAYLALNDRRRATAFANKARSLSRDRKVLGELAAMGF